MFLWVKEIGKEEKKWKKERKMKEKQQRSVSDAGSLFDVRPIRQTTWSWNKWKQVAAAALCGLHSSSTLSACFHI